MLATVSRSSEAASYSLMPCAVIVMGLTRTMPYSVTAKAALPVQSKAIDDVSVAESHILIDRS